MTDDRIEKLIDKECRKVECEFFKLYKVDQETDRQKYLEKRLEFSIRLSAIFDTCTALRIYIGYFEIDEKLDSVHDTMEKYIKMAKEEYK